MTATGGPAGQIIRNETTRLSAAVWGAGQSVWGPDGVTPEVDHLKVHETTAPAEVGALFGDSAVWARRRRYLVGGQPVMLAVSYIPVDLAAGTRMAQPDSGPGGVFARLEEAGRGPARFSEDVWADSPTEEETELLGLVDSPVLRSRRVAFDAAGHAVEVSDIAMVSWVFRLRFEFPA